MKLHSIIANRHLVEDRANGRPVRLLLEFEGERSLRLQVAGDGQRMIIDSGQLDDPFDMGQFGRVDVADVTQSLFPHLSGAEITEVRGLASNGSQTGLILAQASANDFYFWVNGDELWWGDAAVLASHDWLDNEPPKSSGALDL